MSAIDHITGKPVDRVSDLLPKQIDETCDECGTALITRCWSCGAPICCPKCCAEYRRATPAALLPTPPEGDAGLCPMCDDEGEVETGEGHVQRCDCQDPTNQGPPA